MRPNLHKHNTIKIYKFIQSPQVTINIDAKITLVSAYEWVIVQKRVIGGQTKEL